MSFRVLEDYVDEDSPNGIEVLVFAALVVAGIAAAYFSTPEQD